MTLAEQKKRLIRSLTNRGFNSKITGAFNEVAREDFIPRENKEFAYDDEPLPIGYGQTISQPYTIAFMLDLLAVAPGQKIMEVGSGSGYVLALLNALSGGGEIFGVERVPELVERSGDALKGHKNIRIFSAGAALGLPEGEPFDRILVSAAAEETPTELLDQLAEGGILVCPIKHEIVKIKKEKHAFARASYPGFSFVPLVG